MDVLQQEKLAERAAIQGAKLMTRLQQIAARSAHVKQVRGKGLFVGVEVKHGNAMQFCRELLKMGLLANDSHGHTIRISPPLIIDDVELDFMCERLEQVLIRAH
jgi:ornithine--oxo-acid transaminase